MISVVAARREGMANRTKAVTQRRSDWQFSTLVGGRIELYYVSVDMLGCDIQQGGSDRNPLRQEEVLLEQVSKPSEQGGMSSTCGLPLRTGI